MDTKRLIIYPIILGIILALVTHGFTAFGTDGLLIPLIVVLAYFTVFFVIAQIVKDNSIVDMGWGLGFVLGSIATLMVTEEPTLLSYAIAVFITVWGVRLSWRLIRRNWGKPEDFRYANWRKEWGDKVVIIAFFRVFMIQGLVNFVVGSASYATIKYNAFEMTALSQIPVYLGLSIALIGLFFEVVGDLQLDRHIQKRSGTLLDSGLWSLTRHPNYFGEIMIWSGLYIVGVAMMINGTISVPYYLALIISPLLMTAVLLKVSTPLLEKHMEKYDGWNDYAKRTPMIFPWGKKG
ncbi:MAG: DUF1295 domain-containing protein [Bacillota bacterium]